MHSSDHIVSVVSSIKSIMTTTKRNRKICCYTVLRSIKILCIAVGAIFLLTVALVADVVLFQQSKYDDSYRGTSVVTTKQWVKKRSSRTGSAGFQYPIKEEPEGLKIAWLMTFPNSGTSYTTQLVREATKTVSASNYADDTLEGEMGVRDPVFEGALDGPFWTNSEESRDYTKPTEYVITKTHCGIRCNMCPPEKYAETTYSFRSKCFVTKYLKFYEETSNMDRFFASYEPDRLTKAIHLFRDPFDNIVSRFHMEREDPYKLAAQYSNSREGFREFCKESDSLFSANEKRVLFLSQELIEIMKDVPCHSDFLRYVEWHNLAFVTTRDLQLNTHLLHYDWYNTDFEGTVKGLLDFLELSVHKNGVFTPFIKGKEYDYFTPEEKRAVAKAFKMMASPDTWSQTKQYFDEGKKYGDTQIMTVDDTNPGCSTGNDEATRPPLCSLVKEDSMTEILGDVQFLLDFAIVGYPKAATTTTLMWLANQTEIQMYDHEVYHLKDGEPAEMVRQMYALPEGDHYKRGYKAPRDIHNPRALNAFAKYFPKTKLIVGLRHPVLWFESFYNYRTRNNFTLPETDELIGNCIDTAANVCTEEIRYMDHLSILGKTDRTSPEELALLSPINPKQQRLSSLFQNEVFLYEISQLDEVDLEMASQYRKDLQQFLGLDEPLSPIEEKLNAWEDSDFRDLEIDICDDIHEAVRADLMDIATKSSLWLRKYFVASPDVHVSSPQRFNELLEAWMIDPCIERRTNGLVSRPKKSQQ